MTTWPDEYDRWPRGHSNPAMDRDLAADKAHQANRLTNELINLVHDGQATRAEILHKLSLIQQLDSDILRLMERNGAPTRPY